MTKQNCLPSRLDQIADGKLEEAWYSAFSTMTVNSVKINISTTKQTSLVFVCKQIVCEQYKKSQVR